MNAERLRALADEIEPLPHTHQLACENQEGIPYSYGQDGFAMSMFRFSCGSPACIGGYAIARWGNLDANDPLVEVGRVLGIDLQTAQWLCCPGNGTPGFAMLNRPGSLERMRDITPRRAAQTLRRLADTGKVNWREEGR